MEPYKYKMNRDLIEIEKTLIRSKNPQEIDQLIYDKEILLCNLYNKKLKTNLDKIDVDDISAVIMASRAGVPLFKSVIIERKKDYLDRSKIFSQFMKEDIFGLKEIYNQILDDETLFYTSKIPQKTGCNIYLNSLKKNYILIHGTQNPYDEAILVHELGHSKQNLLQNNFTSQKLNSNFGETYSYFLMLVYCDYLKNFGYHKESYNYKCRILNNALIRLEGLFEMFDIDNIKRREFKYNFKVSISSLLAFYLYNIYINEPNKCLELINKFNCNFENVNDYELLKSIGLDFEFFKNNSILSKTKEIMHKEHIKIKQK